MQDVTTVAAPAFCHRHAGAQLGEQLMMAGARTVIADLRHLKSTVVALRGW